MGTDAENKIGRSIQHSLICLKLPAPAAPVNGCLSGRGVSLRRFSGISRDDRYEMGRQSVPFERLSRFGC